MIFIFGIYQIISYFYFSNEVKVLVPLPIKVKNILISKFFVIYVWELLISSFIVLPFFIIYGVKMGLGIFHWIYLLTSFLLIPIVPLVIVGVLTIIIMKITNLSHNKDGIRMFGMLLFAIVLIAFQVFFNKFIFGMPSTVEGQQAYLENILNNSSFLIDKVSVYYPIIGLIQNAITLDFIGATISILLLLGLCIAFVYLFGIYLQAFFLKSYLQEQTNSSKVRKVKTNKRIKAKSVPWAISTIDFITLLKVPIYAFNSLGMVIILPIMLLIYPIAFGDSSEFDIMSLYSQYKEVFWLILAVAMAIFATLDQISASTFSREGKTNWINRTLPISAKDHILGRLLTAFIVQIIFSALTIGILLFILKADYLLALISFIISNVASIPLMLIGILIDLKHPMLNWDNPQQAVKQNMNVLAHMGIGMGYGLLMFLGYKGLSIFLPISAVYVVYLLASCLFAYIIYKILYNQFEESLVVME